MKREKEFPASLLNWLERESRRQEAEVFNNLQLFCTLPVRAVKMKILQKNYEEDFRTVIIPAIDIYITEKAFLKTGFFKREALYFFISGTKATFPYGHVFEHSGAICLGDIFVPSAVPERSPAMPIETLFLHNDRNLNHGHSHLFIDEDQAAMIGEIIKESQVKLSNLGKEVIKKPGLDIIASDEIWNLSADMAEQKPLPEALFIMTKVYNVIFRQEDEESVESEV